MACRQQGFAFLAVLLDFCLLTIEFVCKQHEYLSIYHPAQPNWWLVQSSGFSTDADIAQFQPLVKAP